MKNKDLLLFKKLVLKDYHRITRGGDFKWNKFFLLLVNNFSFKIIFWFRMVILFSNGSCSNKLFLILLRRIHRHYLIKYGITMPYTTKIEGGIFFPHYGLSVINANAIGKNFTIYQGATIGSVRGKGKPIIGDNVVVSCGAQVLGPVIIGSNVMIGAGAVVVTDIPDNAVVVGNPAKVVNYKGKEHVSLYL